MCRAAVDKSTMASTLVGVKCSRLHARDVGCLAPSSLGEHTEAAQPRATHTQRAYQMWRSGVSGSSKITYLSEIET